MPEHIFKVGDSVRVYGLQDAINFKGQVGVVRRLNGGQSYGIEFAGFDNIAMHSLDGILDGRHGYNISANCSRIILPIGINSGDIIVTSNNMYLVYDKKLYTKAGEELDIRCISRYGSYMAINNNGNTNFVALIYRKSDNINNSNFSLEGRDVVYSAKYKWGNINREYIKQDYIKYYSVPQNDEVCSPKDIITDNEFDTYEEAFVYGKEMDLKSFARHGEYAKIGDTFYKVFDKYRGQLVISESGKVEDALNLNISTR